MQAVIVSSETARQEYEIEGRGTSHKRDAATSTERLSEATSRDWKKRARGGVKSINIVVWQQYHSIAIGLRRATPRQVFRSDLLAAMRHTLACRSARAD